MEKASAIDIAKIDTSSPEFQDALKLVQYTSRSVFLTGKAGTGKSTFLKYLTATTKKRYVVLAPTGIAAVNAGGQTIHSFFHLPLKPMLPNDPDMLSARRLRQRLKFTKAQVNLIKKLDLIIIDEVSMVRADTVDFIDRVLRVYTGNNRLPFGGKQLLLVGDIFQLEPVITSDVRDVLSHHYRDGMFFFNAHAFDFLKVVPIELRKVFRQKDDEFIRLLDRMRIGCPIPADFTTLNSLISSADQPVENFTMTIATRREIVDRINEQQLAKLKTPVRTFIGTITGEFPENGLPTDKVLELKEGAQVVFIKNDIGEIDAVTGRPGERRWVNGTIGRIADFGDETIVVELADGSKHAVKPEQWDNVKYSYDEEKKEVKEDVLGSFVQFPLKPAWALTIHKSQGLTFEKVVIDMGHGAFSSGQTYVALSRCRSLAGITMRAMIHPRDVIVNPRLKAFAEQFNSPNLIRAAIESAEADDCYKRASTAFSRGNLDEATSLFARAVTVRNELKRPEAVRLLRRKLSVISDLRDEVASLKSQLAEARRRFLSLATEYVELGEECRNEGWDLQAALANFEKAISLCPDYNLAWIGKARALSDANLFDAAIKAYDTARQLTPDDWRAPLEEGRLVAVVGDIAHAMDLLLIALKNGKDIPDVHSALADAYERIGDDDSAAKHRRMEKKLRRKRNK